MKAYAAATTLTYDRPPVAPYERRGVDWFGFVLLVVFVVAAAMLILRVTGRR